MITRNEEGGYNASIYVRKEDSVPLSLGAVEHLQTLINHRQSFMYMRSDGFPESLFNDLNDVAARVTFVSTAAHEGAIWQAWVKFQPLDTPHGKILQELLDHNVRIDARIRPLEVNGEIKNINGIYLFPA